MKAFYLKGLSTTNEEFIFIKSKFIKYGIELELLCNDYATYSKYNREQIISDLKNKLPQDEQINIVCHSMGCNFGLLLANNMNNIINITFVSPEFEQTTKEEREAIVPSTNISVNVPSRQPFSLNKLKNIMAFFKSRKWINSEVERFLYSNINCLIMYSKGDIFVSRTIMNKMAQADNIEIYEADSNNHNPLLEDTPCIELIAKQLMGKKYEKIRR